jgi:hypothetical protein
MKDTGIIIATIGITAADVVKAVTAEAAAAIVVVGTASSSVVIRPKRSRLPNWRNTSAH